MGKSIRVAKGKEVFEIDAQDLPFAAKDGFLPTERIIVANSKTKESFEIDPADYLNAVNDGFEFADLAKKKEPIPSNLPPSPVPSPSPSDANIEQPVTIQQIRQLESIPQQGTLNVLGTGLGTQYEVATTESPELKAAKKRYAEQLGVDYGDLQEMLQDFPNADETFIATAKKYKEQSPELYRRYLDASYALRALPKEQQADFNEWQSYQSLPQLESNMAKAMEALSSNKEAQRRLYRTNAPFINPSNDDIFVGTQQFNKDYSAKLQSPISEFEYSGLKTLEIFNPDIAKQYKDILLNHSDVREGQLAYERVSKELESIGRENLIRAAKETNDIVRYYENAIKQAETPEKAQAIAAEAQKDTRVKNAAKVSGAVEQMMLRQQYDSLRYTQLGMLQAEKVYNDIARSNMTTLDALAAMPKEFLVGGGRIVNNALQTLGDLVVGNTWVMPDAETKNMISAFSQATAQQESDSRYLQKSLYNLTPDLQAQVDDILKSDVDSETKRSQVIQLVLGNPDKIIPNAKADETDVKSQDILLGGAKLFGEVFALSLLARGTGAGAASTRMQQAATTFGSTALGFYNDMYNSAVSSGSKNPRLDAALDTAIAALSELISPDYQVVRRFLGKSSSPILLGLTEETWNAVMRRLPNLPTAALRGGIAAAKNLGGEVIEEVAGAAGQQVKDRVIMGRETAREDASFGEKMAFGQGIQRFSDAVTNAALQTAVLMAVPSTVTMITNARGISADAKTKLYALGVRGEAGLPADMPEKIRKVVTEMQAIVANIKDNYPELNEKQRTEMAFNMYRKKAIQANKATMTEKQKDQADKAIIEADDAIEATVAGENAVIEQIDGDAKVETDAIDKKIESLNPESEGYKEKKAELKEEKATIKQTAEERKAALKEAVRAAFPQTPTNEPTTTEANQPTEAIEGATSPQQIEAGTPTGVQPSIGDVGQGRPAGNVAIQGDINDTGLILYHGTPHSFDIFDLSKIGTGEGAQAFGYGLYFTNKKSIAENYANVLSSKQKFWKALEDGSSVSLSKEDYDFISDELDALGFEGQYAEEYGLGDILVDGKVQYNPAVLDALSVLFGKDAKKELSGYDLSDEQMNRLFEMKKKITDPQLYTVQLHRGKSPNQYDYLNWDSPLTDAQKKKIGGYEGNSGREVYLNIANGLGSDKKASEYLLSKGIDGIVYKTDRGTGGGDGTGRNYVVFDARAVTITDINGEAQEIPEMEQPSQPIPQSQAEPAGNVGVVDLANKILILLSKSDKKGVDKIKRRSEIGGISLLDAVKDYLKNYQSISGKGKNRFEELELQVKYAEPAKNVAPQPIPESGDIKAAGKAAADFIRTLRPPSNTAQSNILGLPIAVYDTAIVAIANAVEAGATVAQAIADVVADLQRQFPNWKEANKFTTEVEWAGKMRPFISQQVAQFPDLTTEEIMEVIADEAPHLIATPEQEQAVRELVNKSIEDYAVQEQSAAGVDVRQQAEDGEGMGEGNAEIPPTPPTGEQIGGDEEGPKLRDKGILNRLYNAERIPQQAREAFKDNLKYEPKSQVEAEKIAQGIIAEFGIDEAVLRAEAGTFHGDVNSMIFATALNQLYEQESKAQGDGKVAIAKKFADISMRYDEAARSGGRFISAIGYFYKKSPLGMRMFEEANRNEQFKEWIKSKENDYRAFFEELMKEPEVQEMVEKGVRERLKKERAQKRTERKKKVNDAIDKWINDLGKQTYSSVVPPTVLIPVLKAAKGLYNAGESVLEIVEKAVDSIDEKMNGADWDRDAFRTKLTGMLDEAESADELKRQRAIEKFRNKLKGLSEEQKDKLIRKSLRKLVADGALEFDDFKKMLADIIGMGEMSPEEIAAFEQTVKDMNAAADVADEIANAETLTPEMMQRYNEARVKAEKAAIAYGDLVYNKPDITKRLLSYLQLAPLGIKALVTNPFYNVWQHVAVRIPTAVVGNVVDTILYRASQVGNSIWGTDVLYPKNDPRNIAEVQKQFFKGGFLGTKKAISQVVTGLTDKDYIQKDMYNSRNKPLVAIRDIFNQLTKKKLMTNKQVFDKMLQGTLGITMEGVARLLNVGDKPMRYAAERAEAARFAKELGLKDLELDFFMELPREIAFREYKKRGMTDEAAGEKADEIVDGIIKSGEKSVFQGDNILATAIDSFFEKFGLTGRIFRVLNLPYVKTPLNSLWSLYNLVNPYVALAQVTFYGGRAVANKSRKDYEESKYWLGHAVSGFALHALMGALVQYGIFSPPDEDDESKREREGRKTYNPNGKVNITKLMAFLDGGDPNAVKNGIIVDIQYFGVMGVLGAMITKKNQEMTEEQRKNGMAFIENQLMNLDITTKHFIDQGIFGQTSLAIEAFQKRGAALDQWLLGMINMGTNVVQPAMYAQISRAQLPYYSRQKADAFMGQVKNSMLSRSSVLRDLMGEMPPSKIGVWGDTMSKGGSEFMDVMGRLFGVTRENDDNFAQPIYEDYVKYNDPLFFPPALKPELDGKKLTAQQYDDLQIFVGQQRKELAKPYVNDGATIPFINKKYSELSKEQKLKALEYIYEVGKENGIVLFTQKYKEFQKPFEAPTYESIMEKINNKYMQSFKQMLPKIRN